MNLVEKIKKNQENKERKKGYKKSFAQNYSIEPYYSKDYTSKSDIDLITISFNAPKLILEQIKIFKKFLKGNYRFIVCDNSTLEDCSQMIKTHCIQNDITYIRVLDRSIPNGYSNSHAIALNWVWKNVVQKRKNNFAFLDHDIFPVKEIDICSYVNQKPVFGRYKKLDCGVWYMWAGFAFFNYEYVKNLPLNFHRYKAFGLFKVKYADTGSANWNCLYKKLNINDLNPCSDELYGLGDDDILRKYTNEKITVNYFANESWLHILDGGDRYKTNAQKVERVLKYLDRL